MPDAMTKKSPPMMSTTTMRATATASKRKNITMSHGLMLSAYDDGGPPMGANMPGNSTILVAAHGLYAERGPHRAASAATTPRDGQPQRRGGAVAATRRGSGCTERKKNGA
mmetsp:Transcript_72103/g.181791  ORF Transcript_72103/g.181791 Transcript_72103/m.181791 type:complete len:111 (+) Transcript_72103:540-872(+)